MTTMEKLALLKVVVWLSVPIAFLVAVVIDKKWNPDDSLLIPIAAAIVVMTVIVITTTTIVSLIA